MQGSPTHPPIDQPADPSNGPKLGDYQTSKTRCSVKAAGHWPIYPVGFDISAPPTGQWHQGLPRHFELPGLMGCEVRKGLEKYVATWPSLFLGLSSIKMNWKQDANFLTVKFTFFTYNLIPTMASPVSNPACVNCQNNPQILNPLRVALVPMKIFTNMIFHIQWWHAVSYTTPGIESSIVNAHAMPKMLDNNQELENHPCKKSQSATQPLFQIISQVMVEIISRSKFQ